MDIIIRILTALFLLFFGVTSSTEIPPEIPEPQTEETVRIATVIESVEPLILESFPVQITLQVTGYHPDGCDYPVQVTQERVENRVIVEIYRELPLAVMCPAILRTYEDTIPLGEFAPGTYIIEVNGSEYEVTV